MSKNDLQDTNDLCPVNDSGNHRYFIFKTFEVYEPTALQYGDLSDNGKARMANGHIPDLYKKVEYAISGCNCGSAIKQVVRQA